MDLCEVSFKGKKLAAVSNAFVGIVADIDVIAEPWRWMGSARFDIAAVWQIARMPKCYGVLKAIHFDGSVQEFPSGSYLGFTVSLTQHWAEKMRPNPDLIMDDGSLTLSIVSGSSSRGQLLGAFLLLDKGAHKSLGDVFQSVVVEEVQYHTDSPGYFNIDGEMYLHDGHIAFTVAHRKLNLAGCRDVEESVQFLRKQHRNSMFLNFVLLL